MCVHINQPFFYLSLPVFFITITAAVIEAVLRRSWAVYLHLGGQEECNRLTMIMLWVIRLWATVEYLALIRISPVKSNVAHKQKGRRKGEQSAQTSWGRLEQSGFYALFFSNNCACNFN